jgi:hypothetical protein
MHHCILLQLAGRQSFRSLLQMRVTTEVIFSLVKIRVFGTPRRARPLDFKISVSLQKLRKSCVISTDNFPK